MAAVHHEISNHLKMAPYRQGGAGKGASLVVDDNESPGHSDHSDNDSDQEDEPDEITAVTSMITDC